MSCSPAWMDITFILIWTTRFGFTILGLSRVPWQNVAVKPPFSSHTRLCSHHEGLVHTGVRAPAWNQSSSAPSPISASWWGLGLAVVAAVVPPFLRRTSPGWGPIEPGSRVTSRGSLVQTGGSGCRWADPLWGGCTWRKLEQIQGSGSSCSCLRVIQPQLLISGYLLRPFYIHFLCKNK